MIEAELFDGTVLEFPEGTDPAIIQRKVKEITAQKRGPQMPVDGTGAALGPSTPAFADGDPRNAPPPTADEALLESIMGPTGRGLQVGLQGAGRGAADFLGMVGDLSTGAANLGLAGVDNLVELIAGDMAPDALDFRFGPSPVGSDAIAGGASAVADAIGLGTIDPETMSTGERFGYAANRFGTTGLVAGASIAKGVSAADDAAAMAQNVSPGVKSRVAAAAPGAGKQDKMVQTLVEPYRMAPGRTLAGDTAAGVGAGIGVEAVDQNVPDDAAYKPVATLLASLFGGLGGAGVAKVATDAVPAIATEVWRKLTGRSLDWDLPLPQDGSGPISKRVAEMTARTVQGQAVDSKRAAQTLGDNLAEFPNPNAPKPGPFAMSEDLGLRRMEASYRNDPAFGPKMEAQDAQAMDYATERLLSILDEGADQAGTLSTIRARPGEIKSAREDAALPILREAEASTATVDVAPIASMIDDMLVGPKRQEIINALTAAKRALTPKGKGETLGPDLAPKGPTPSGVLGPDGKPIMKPAAEPYDTTVKGLYESRKAISDLIEGRSENNTGKFAQGELIEIKKALDKAIIDAEGKFGEYLGEFKAGSRPLDVFESSAATRLVDSETDLRNVAKRILSPGRYGTDKELTDVMSMIGDNPEAQRGWKAAVADVLVDRVTKNMGGEDLRPDQIATVYNQHRDTLAKVFSPEDMGALDEVHRLLKIMSQPKASALSPNLAGTQTLQPMAAVQAALLASGRDMITTTMIMSRLNFVAKFLGADQMTMPYKVNEVLLKMQTDPDLALAILNRPVSEATGATWSRDVQKLLAGSAAARDMAAPDEDEEMTNTIMDGFGQDRYGRPLPQPEVGGP